MRKKLLTTLALLLMAVSGAWAQDPAWLQFGDEWDPDTKTLTVNSDPGDSYKSQTQIEHLIIGSYVQTIGDNAFSSVPQNAKVYVLPPIPPTLGYNAFGSYSVTFYVYGDEYSNWNGNVSKTKIYGVYFRAGKPFSGTPVVSYNGTDYYEAGATLTLDDGTNYVVTKDEDDSDVTDDVLSGSTLTVPAYDITVMAISGNCGASGNNVTWAYNSKVLTISGTGAMADYTEDTEQPWYGYQDDIEEIIIGDYVTHIGDYAFAYFYNGNQPLSVTIPSPSNVTSIGAYAFFNCGDLTSITIPSSVTTIGENAFDGCDGLTSITLAEGLTTIYDHAFNNCNSLTSITIPSTVTGIGWGAFENCTSLASVTILATELTTYGGNSFLNTAAGLKIYVPAASLNTYKSNWSIYENNFKGLYTVTLSSLPDGVTGVASANLAVAGETVTLSFSGVPAGKVLVVSGTYKSGEYDYDLTITDNGDGTYSFDMGEGPATITAELKNDFTTCKVTLPDQTLIPPSIPGINGFTGLYGKFDYANYNKTAALIEEIGIEVKTNDESTTLVFGTDYQFGMVNGLNGADPNDSNIGDEFEVEIMGIGDYAGTKTKTVKIKNPGGEWGDLTWSLVSGTLTISGTGEMNTTSNYYGYGFPWFSYRDNITNIVIGSGITNVADKAFGAHTGEELYGNVTAITLPSSLTTIGSYAFNGCRNANLEITVPTSVVSVGEGAFNGVVCVNATLSDPVDDNTNNNTALIARLFEAMTADITYKRTFTEKVASTICLPFAVSQQKAAEVGTFYDFTSVDGDWTEVTMTEVNTSLTANTPYLFMPDATGEQTFSGTATNGATAGTKTVGEWTFTGTYAQKRWDANNNSERHIFGFSTGQGYEGTAATITTAGVFIRLTTGGINPFRAYLKYTGSLARTRGEGGLPETMTVRLVGANGEIQGIGEIKLDTGEVTFDSRAWYDLNGRRLDGKPSEKGIYINGGRKVVIK